MESLLTLSIGEYRSVEIALQLVVVLTGMMALLLALSIACVTRQYRFPLGLAAVALGGATWFLYGVWDAWHEAFELAGTSYCVTGHLLDSEGRIIAWSLGVPAILFAFGLVQIPWGKAPGYFMETLTISALVIAILSPISPSLHYVGALVLVFSVTLFYLGRRSKSSALLIPKTTRLAIGIIILSYLAGTFFSLWNIAGKAPEAILVHGEIIRAAIDFFSLVIPAILLLIGVLRLSNQEVEATKP